MTQKPIIGFVGMTHLGLNSAIAGAARGFTMVCFDPDAALIARLNAGQMPVKEPQLDALVAQHKPHITFTADATALQNCDVVYVAPDVATDDQGQSDLSNLDHLLALTFQNTRTDAAIVVLSQVPPGFSRARQQANRTLIYQVETLIFGQAIDRALNPERTIIGVMDPAQPLPAAYETYLKGHGNPPLFPMRYESAELAKIAINCCLVSSVSVANTLAELCEKIGANWAEIVPTLKLDRRIGPYSYLAPGLGISGGNLERDLQTVINFADQHGTDANVVRAWLDNSRYRKNWPLRMLATHVFPALPKPVIGILGMTYKENTHSVKNSPSVALIRQLPDYQLQAFDPAIKPLADWHPTITNTESALAAAKGCDVLLLMTAWPEFRALDVQKIAQAMRGKIVIDPFALLDTAAARAAGLNYITLGVMADAAA